MAWNHDEISFRDIAGRFLLVKDIDMKSRFLIEKSGFKIRQDDNAMLLFGYIDYNAGISFELLCAACVFDDGEVSFEPMNKTTTCKLRYGSFTGDMVPLDNLSQLIPYRERAEMIIKGYGAPDDVLEIRKIKELDSSRAPGYPDDIVVFFVKEGYKNEGIWCRVVSADPETHLVQMRMLNEPYATFGKHVGEIIDVMLIPMDDGEVKAFAVL